MQKIETQLINPFIHSTVNFFKTAIGIDIEYGDTTLKEEPFPGYDISVVVGLWGLMEGSVVLSFPKQVIQQAVVNFLGEDIKMGLHEIVDATMEFGNIIVGNAKDELSEYKFEMTLPNIILGKEHTVWQSKDNPPMIVSFKTMWGTFALEVNFMSIF